MKKKNFISEILKLTVSERIEFVEDVWDSIANVPKSVSLTDKQKEELDKRLKNFRENPDAGSPWSVVKKRILSKK